MIAANDPNTPPAQRAAYQAPAKQMQEAEIKKFTYAQRATGGGNDERRQPMIDAATAEIQRLNDWQFDPDANDGRGGFIDPKNSTKAYSPEEFTDMKNQVATKLDAQLAKAKLRPLGVRFNVKSTTPGVGADGSLLPPGQAQAPATPAQTAPPQAQPRAAPAPPAGATQQYRDKSGRIVGYGQRKYVPTAGQTAPTPPVVPKEQMNEGRTGTDDQGNQWKVMNGQFRLMKEGSNSGAMGMPTIRDGAGKQLADPNLARQYLEKAGGDKDKARQLAKHDGWRF